MKSRLFAFPFLAAAAALVVTLWFAGESRAGVFSRYPDVLPEVTHIQPDRATNDLDAVVTITGTGFAAVISGTQVLTSPALYLGDTALPGVTWVSATLLTAHVPWGLDAGVYTLTVVNPDGGTGLLPNAFTVEPAIGVWTTEGPYGGTINQILVDPSDPATLYARATTGVFRSRDAGTHWQQALVHTSLADLLLDPNNPSVLYAIWWGINKSTDGGDTWTYINPPQDASVMHLLVDPSDSNHLYGAGVNGFFHSTNGGQTWEVRNTGLEKSPGGEADLDVTDIAIHPTDPTHLFLSTFEGRIFHSIDQGAHWQLLVKPDDMIGVIRLDIFPPYNLWAGSCGNIAYHNGTMFKIPLADPANYVDFPDLQISCGGSSITFDPQTSGMVYVTTSNAGFKTTDDGDTWQRIPAIWTHGFLNFAVISDTDHTLYGAEQSQGVWVSKDGGETWSERNNGLTGVVASTIVAAAGRPDEAYAGTNAGLFYSANGGHAWRQLPILDRFLATDPFSSTRLYAGGLNRVTIFENQLEVGYATLTNSVPSWCSDCTSQGSAISIAADPVTPGRLIASLNYDSSLLPRPSDRGGFFISVDYGLSWQAHQPDTYRVAQNKLVFSPSNPDIVYAAGSPGIYKSVDSGLTWQTISPPGLENFWFYYLAVNPQNPDIVITAHWEKLYRTMDGGETWEAILDTGWGNLVYLPSNPPVLYFGANGAYGLWQSLDNGTTWSLAAGSLGTLQVTPLLGVTDGERAILYVSTPGGFGSTAVTGSTTGESATLVNSGVYRMVQRLPNHRVYLPGIFR
jgi:photosystem II stability/assembly factor-like uncharacterized protein